MHAFFAFLVIFYFFKSAQVTTGEQNATVSSPAWISGSKIEIIQNASLAIEQFVAPLPAIAGVITQTILSAPRINFGFTKGTPFVFIKDTTSFQNTARQLGSAFFALVKTADSENNAISFSLLSAQQALSSLRENLQRIYKAEGKIEVRKAANSSLTFLKSAVERSLLILDQFQKLQGFVEEIVNRVQPSTEGEAKHLQRLQDQIRTIDQALEQAHERRYKADKVKRKILQDLADADCSALDASQNTSNYYDLFGKAISVSNKIVFEDQLKLFKKFEMQKLSVTYANAGAAHVLKVFLSLLSSLIDLLTKISAGASENKELKVALSPTKRRPIVEMINLALKKIEQDAQHMSQTEELQLDSAFESIRKVLASLGRQDILKDQKSLAEKHLEEVESISNFYINRLAASLGKSKRLRLVNHRTRVPKAVLKIMSLNWDSQENIALRALLQHKLADQKRLSRHRDGVLKVASQLNHRVLTRGSAAELTAMSYIPMVQVCESWVTFTRLLKGLMTQLTQNVMVVSECLARHDSGSGKAVQSFGLEEQVANIQRQVTLLSTTSTELKKYLGSWATELQSFLPSTIAAVDDRAVLSTERKKLAGFLKSSDKKVSELVKQDSKELRKQVARLTHTIEDAAENIRKLEQKDAKVNRVAVNTVKFRL